MEIKYPPLLSLKADLADVKPILGRIVIVATIKNKEARLILEHAEAQQLASKLKSALTSK